MDRRNFLIGLMGGTAALAVTQTPATAQMMAQGGMATPQYLVMAMRGGMFLEETARIAFDKTQDPRVRRFARAEVLEQVTLSDRLNANADIPTAAAPGALGNPAGGALVGAGVGALVGGPVGALVGAGIGATTGTVATAAGGIPTQAVVTTDAQKAATIAQLQGLPPSPQFDAAFVNASILGHQEAYTIHGAYAQSGEDPALRRIARNALPLIRLHLSQLSRMQAMMQG
ncbi:MAG TPA: DUF4142 domain-containing protein [Beijerinckiaceae bacterium]|jgi:predicted outer membrane protein